MPCLQRKVVTATCWAHLCSIGSIISSFKSGATSSLYPLPATASYRSSPSCNKFVGLLVRLSAGGACSGGGSKFDCFRDVA